MPASSHTSWLPSSAATFSGGLRVATCAQLAHPAPHTAVMLGVVKHDGAHRESEEAIRVHRRDSARSHVRSEHQVDADTKRAPLDLLGDRLGLGLRRVQRAALGHVTLAWTRSAEFAKRFRSPSNGAAEVPSGEILPGGSIRPIRMPSQAACRCAPAHGSSNVWRFATALCIVGVCPLTGGRIPTPPAGLDTMAFSGHVLCVSGCL